MDYLRRLSRPVRWLLLVALTIPFAVTYSSLIDGEVNAQRGRCGDEAFCQDPFPNYCLPVPTTLPSVSSTWSGGYGFRVAGNNCGARQCYYFFSCPCGPPLSGGQVCGAGEGGSDDCSQDTKKEVGYRQLYSEDKT